MGIRSLWRTHPDQSRRRNGELSVIVVHRPCGRRRRVCRRERDQCPGRVRVTPRSIAPRWPDYSRDGARDIEPGHGPAAPERGYRAPAAYADLRPHDRAAQRGACDLADAYSRPAPAHGPAGNPGPGVAVVAHRVRARAQPDTARGAGLPVARHAGAVVLFIKGVLELLF